jgi:UDP-glucose 4-epimerase
MMKFVKNVLVTGAAGFIGSHLVDKLLEDQVGLVIGLDNFFLGRKGNLSRASGYSNFRLIRGDASDVTFLQDITRNFDITDFYSLATIPLPTSLAYPKWSSDQNLKIASSALEIARSGFVERLIQISTSEVYGTGISNSMTESHPLSPRTPYAASKASADLIALSYQRSFGTPILILRPFNNFGPRQNHEEFAGLIPKLITSAIKQNEFEIHGDGKQLRDWVYVEDTARAIMDLAKHNESWNLGTINISSNMNFSVSEVVNLFSKYIPPLQVKLEAKRLGDVEFHKGSNQLMKTLLGWSPRTFEDETMKKTVDYYKDLYRESTSQLENGS